jgi:hypothetical protein
MFFYKTNHQSCLMNHLEDDTSDRQTLTGAKSAAAAAGFLRGRLAKVVVGNH